ncbi:putative protein phosphatase [Hypsibius exemplaris]|uniref:protein-serine/threonine phosphatase n=1 Tax=Hypsibius exemplaris TaxID=2072580 RepID=A0A9X6N937_HYPEX|nr:putative protein phosphatase [Hypsibius exemplaris]
MGSYLSQPVREKESDDGSQDLVDFGASAMQGWRISQEDAHVANLNFDQKSMLFAVFDGHGGAEVAKYAALHMGNHIKSLDKYKQGDYEGALVEAFLSFDALLREPHIMEILKALSKSDSEAGDKADGDSSSSEEEEEELADLLDEADESVEEVIKRVGAGGLGLDMAQLLRNAVAKVNGMDVDSDSDDDDDEEEKEDGNETEEADSTDADSQDDEDVAPAVTGLPPIRRGDSYGAAEIAKSDQEALRKVVLNHLSEAFGQESTPEDSKAGTGFGSAAPLADANAPTQQNGASSVEGATASSTAAKSVIIDDDAADKPSIAAVSSAASSSAGCSSLAEAGSSASTSTGSGSAVDHLIGNGGGDEADEDDEEYNPENGQMDSDDDDEDDWEDDPTSASPQNGAARRMLLAPGLLEYGGGAMGQSMVSGFDSGATACVAFIKDDILYVANAGDSRCVVCQDGKAIEMSFDHKPEDPLETARIYKAGGKVTADGRVNNGLNLSRALGDHNYKGNVALDLSEQMISAKPDIKTLQLNSSHQFLVIACDGIWNSMNSQQVIDFVRQRIDKRPPGSLSKICEELFDTVIAPTSGGDGTGMDNCTCVIVRFGHPTTSLPLNEPEPEPAPNGAQEMPVSSPTPLSSASQKRVHEEVDGDNMGEEDKSSKKIKTNGDETVSYPPPTPAEVADAVVIAVNGHGGAE